MPGSETALVTGKEWRTASSAGESTAEEAHIDDSSEERSSMVEEYDAVPTGDMHHPILGLKLPSQGPAVEGDLLSD